MGKIFVLSVTDHEEYVLSRIMEIIAACLLYTSDAADE